MLGMHRCRGTSLWYQHPREDRLWRDCENCQKDCDATAPQRHGTFRTDVVEEPALIQRSESFPQMPAAIADMTNSNPPSLAIVFMERWRPRTR